MSSAQEVGQIFATAESPHGPETALLRSPTVIIASIGLWAMNVYLFDVFGIDYKRVLRSSSSNSIQKQKYKDDRNDSATNNVDSSSSSLSSISSSSKNNEKIGNGNAEMENLIQIVEEQQLDKLENTSVVGETVKLASSEKVPASPVIMSELEESDDEVTAGKLFFLCFILLILLHFTTQVVLHIFHGNAFEAIVMFYVVCGLVVLMPQTRPDWLWTAIVVVVERVKSLLTPRCRSLPKTTPFIDVFFADAMCSLSKVFFDWGLLWTMIYHYPNAIPESLSSIMLPSLLSSWPYIVRARQCLVSYSACVLSNDPKRSDHVLNAIKYSTSLFPICLSAYQKTMTPSQARRFDTLFIVLLIINSLYSFAWDVIKDWGMAQKPTYVAAQVACGANDETSLQKVCLRPRLRFGALASTAIILIDLILRFSWTLRFVHETLFDSFDSFVLTTQFLEIFRRAIWNLLRVEWEILKSQNMNNKGKYEKEHEMEAPILFNPPSGAVFEMKKMTIS